MSPQKSNPVSPKATAGGAGAALGTLIWLALGIFGVLPDDADSDAVTAATGATATVLSFAFAWMFRDPRRQTGD